MKKKPKLKGPAVEFMMSMRGQYIIGQALFIASKVLMAQPEERRELSNIKDMEYLIKELFPLYAAIASKAGE